MKPLAYSQRSLDEIEGILEYISSDNPRAAIAFVEDLIATCQRLQSHPELGMKRFDLAAAYASRLSHLLPQPRRSSDRRSRPASCS